MATKMYFVPPYFVVSLPGHLHCYNTISNPLALCQALTAGVAVSVKFFLSTQSTEEDGECSTAAESIG